MASSSTQQQEIGATTEESCSLVHERQSLQLCAIHTINNLLQLTKDNKEGWTCGAQRLKCSWTLATKTELDEIADELTVAENQLFVDSDGQDVSLQPSLYQKLSSQHRTVVFGRYSSEVQNVLRNELKAAVFVFKICRTHMKILLLHPR